jgi:hypothetical protein
VIGELYDEVVSSSKRMMMLCETAVAGRKLDRYGQILCTRGANNQRKTESDDVFDSSIPDRLGFSRLPGPIKGRLIAEAISNRREFENEVLMVANKYGIRSEGELFTGCVRKFHKLHTKNQSVIAEECRRAFRQIQHIHRRFFFESVLELALERDDHSSDVYADMDADEVNRLVQSSDPSEQCKVLRSIAFHLIAAYYVVTYENQDAPAADGQALFAFPWLLADVMSEGLMGNHDAE